MSPLDFAKWLITNSPHFALAALILVVFVTWNAALLWMDRRHFRKTLERIEAAMLTKKDLELAMLAFRVEQWQWTEAKIEQRMGGKSNGHSKGAGA